MIDFNEIRYSLRTILLGGEEVDLITTGETIGIRKDIYDPLYHTRPDAPAVRPIVTTATLAVEGRDFNPTSRAYWVREDFLPNVNSYWGNTVEQFIGIMQYTVFGKKNAGTEDVDTRVRLICELFDRSLGSLSVDQYSNTSLIVDSVERAPALIDEVWRYVPISLNIRTYNVH